MPNRCNFMLSCNKTRYFLLLVYCLMLVFGTWYPLMDWDWSIGGVSEFMAMDRFDHLGGLDAAINLVIYLPVGFLAALLLAPIAAGRRLLVIGLSGGLLSVVLEMGQTFLPGRFTSLSDIILNTVGTLLGALAAMAFQCRRLVYKNGHGCHSR